MNWTFLIHLVFYYVLLTLFIYFFSDFSIFPAPTPPYKDQDIPGVIKLITQDGKEITAVHLENPAAFYTVLFSHGNAEDLETIFPYLELYYNHGFSMFAYDYHGYGSSQGKPSENNTYLDIQAAYEYLTKILNVPAKQIILHGRSLGTGPTVDLASQVDEAGVILESSMLTAFRVVTHVPLFFLDKYRNNQKIKKVKTSLLFMHGTNDEVIPFSQGQALYRLATARKEFYAVQDANHNDILQVAGNKYWEVIINFSQSLKNGMLVNR